MSVRDFIDARDPKLSNGFFELSQGDVGDDSEDAIHHLGQTVRHQAFVVSELLKKVPKGAGTGNLRVLKGAIAADLKELNLLGAKITKVAQSIRDHADDMFAELLEWEER
jgi:hypothetical protein